MSGGFAKEGFVGRPGQRKRTTEISWLITQIGCPICEDRCEQRHRAREMIGMQEGQAVLSDQDAWTVKAAGTSFKKLARKQDGCRTDRFGGIYDNCVEPFRCLSNVAHAIGNDDLHAGVLEGALRDFR